MNKEELEKKVKNHSTNRMNIAVVGMPQSGTTALYNIVNFILRLNHFKVKNALYHPTVMHNNVINEEYLRTYTGDEILIVKEHHFIPFLCNEWSDIIFVSKRDIRDSIASRLRRGKTLISKGKMKSVEHTYDANSPQAFQRWCEYLTDDCFKHWVESAEQNKRKILPIDYVEFKTNPRSVIKLIYGQLKEFHNNLRLDEDKVLDAINNLHRYDEKTTFFSPSKITNSGEIGSFKNNLSQEEIKYINQNFKEWINE